MYHRSRDTKQLLLCPCIVQPNHSSLHLVCVRISKSFFGFFNIVDGLLALNYELKGTGVTVTLLCPGAVATAFGSRAGNENSLVMKYASQSVRISGIEFLTNLKKGILLC